MSALGELLRERRLEHQWTLADAAQRTRIRQEYLEALEEGLYDQLPADVHVRGFLRNYALNLGLSTEEVLSLYQQERGDPDLASIAPISRPPRTRSFVLPSLIFALLATLVMAAIGFVIYFSWLNPSAPPVTPTEVKVTPTAILPTATPTVRLLLDTPTPTASPAPTARTYEGVEAVLRVSESCWVRVLADGVMTYEGTLRGGTEHTFRATEELTIRMGNAGGVQVILNGQDLGVQGARGQVLTQTWRTEQ